MGQGDLDVNTSLAVNLSYAFFAQVISLMVSLVTSLIVPKFLDLEQFGFWQLFIFYSSYVGFFHFGLNDGVYLIKGGKTREEIECDEIKGQFFCGLVLEGLSALGIFLFTIAACDESNRAFVLCSTAVYLVLKNSSDYFGYVFQATNETKLYSVYSMVDRICFLVMLLALIFLNTANFRPYVISYVIARVIGMLYCLAKARSYLEAIAPRTCESFSLSIASMKVGIKLLLANLTSMLILGFGRFLIDESWGIVTFGQLSLSLSLVNFVLAFATQFAMVLFPALRQSKGDEQIRIYVLIRDFLQLVTPIIYLFYFPLLLLVRWWLPAYNEAASYLGLLLPICIFDVKMNLLGTTFFKVLRKEGALLMCNAGCLALSIALSLIGVYVLMNITFVVVGMVFCIIVRSILAESLLAKPTRTKIFSSQQAFEIGLTTVFMMATTLLPLNQAFVVVLVLCLAYCIAFREILSRISKVVCNRTPKKKDV